MRFFEKFRALVFWILDMLKGRPLRKEYKEVRFLFERSGSEKAKKTHEKHLKKLLQHAVNTTQFYSSFTGFKTLQNFPIIDKNTLKKSPLFFISAQFKNQSLHRVTTSGSTGAPLTVFQDQGKRLRHTAENIYFSDILNYRLGTRLYYTRVWNVVNKKSNLKTFFQNIVMQDAGNLSEENLENFIRKLKHDKSTKSILGFASTLEALGNYVSTKQVVFLPGQVKSIISISETLPDGAKDALKKAFNCPVVARYSNMENGFLAQQCIAENNEYHLNLASFHFEILHPEKDEPVAPGEIGRIVVTDLFNYAMPIIRYDTGDMAVLSEKSKCGAPGPVFSKLDGRKVDFIYDTSGNLLSPHVITNTMWKYANRVRQFQFIQNDINQYVIKLNCERPKFNQEQEILDDLKSYTGPDSNIEIEYVEDIPLLASGKRKKVVNLYKPG
jgi:phenylacetate-CoA ligase